MDNSILVADFISQIWNNRDFEKLSNFLHPDFKDYSLPKVLQPGNEGIRKWIINTGVSFEHHTIIEKHITEGDESIVKIRMNLKHIGVWRDIKPNGIELTTIGFRYFKLKDGKIIEHDALIDGQAIEYQLKSAAHNCQIAE